jgi:Acetyltransferase (GNAT) family
LNDTQAEIAVLVDDAWQGEGIGSRLIEHLAAVARRAGIQELVGDVFATNVTMLRTSASLAPAIARTAQDDAAAEPTGPTGRADRLLQSRPGAGLIIRTSGVDTGRLRPNVVLHIHHKPRSPSRLQRRQNLPGRRPPASKESGRSPSAKSAASSTAAAATSACNQSSTPKTPPVDGCEIPRRIREAVFLRMPDQAASVGNRAPPW